jgi:MFS family permease
MESLFSAFNGVFMALAIVAAPVVAVVGVGASPLELTILVSAFPVGAFLGPLWAGLGRRWGMKRLVTQMAVWANLPLFAVFQVRDPAVFTALIAVSQLLNSAMRMGQSSLYGLLYSKPVRGRVLGKLNFWTYVTLVPSVVLTGWLLNKSHEMYRVLYPLAGLCGLIACWYYHQLQVPHGEEMVAPSQAGFGERFREVEDILHRDRAWRQLQTVFFLCGSAFFLTTHVILVLVRDRFSFTPFELALWLSVTPQLLLALTSPVWGRVFDRLGMGVCRVLIGLLCTSYLGCYFVGILAGVPFLVVMGSVLLGISNGGGQVTWSLASTWSAPSPRDIPVYNGIHFVFNGIRGLVMPWVGAVLLVLFGAWSVLAGMLVAAISLPVNLRIIHGERVSPPPNQPRAPARGAVASPPRSRSGLVRSERCDART